jgi:tRNA (cmo5U34)-methyltransferase
MQAVRDQTQPSGRWSFDGEVTAAFDDMLARSIPQYPAMRDAVTSLAVRYAQKGTDIVDLGCSRGQALAPIIDRLGAANRYVGCDVSEPMLEAAKGRFSGWINNGLLRIENCDLRTSFPACRASVILSILTLQFVPIEYRQRIISDIYNHLTPGGAFIFVEKILGADGPLNQTMVDVYYDLKRANGYDQESIDRKRLSLEGVLVPITAAWNEQLLRSAGFAQVDCFWRWMNFAGWVAVKGGG